MRERQEQILDILNQKKQVTVSELVKVFNVSDVTVRKDLLFLEEKGLLKREHGFATLPESDDVSKRLLYNYKTKRRIALKVIESVKDYETIMIESGSCCALLAEQVANKRRGVTIITNSVFIANFLRDKPSVRIILLGGEFQPESQVMIGPLVRASVQNFNIDKFFIGSDGFNDFGAMGLDMMRAEAVRNMAESARRTIILTESKKFSRTSVVPLLFYEKISTIYTDDNISDENLKKLKTKGVQIALVNAEK